MRTRRQPYKLASELQKLLVTHYQLPSERDPASISISKLSTFFRLGRVFFFGFACLLWIFVVSGIWGKKGIRKVSCARNCPNKSTLGGFEGIIQFEPCLVDAGGDLYPIPDLPAPYIFGTNPPCCQYIR